MLNEEEQKIVNSLIERKAEKLFYDRFRPLQRKCEDMIVDLVREISVKFCEDFNDAKENYPDITKEIISLLIDGRDLAKTPAFNFLPKEIKEYYFKKAFKSLQRSD